jgi:hypothetical protein
MATAVTIVDEWTPGGARNEWALELLTEKVTAREIIRSRVYQEVTEYNARATGTFQGLGQPTDAERVLNGFRVREGRKIDWEAQLERAIRAFQSNGIILLVDDRQLTELDEEVVVQPGTSVTFLRLLPLVGG